MNYDVTFESIDSDSYAENDLNWKMFKGILRKESSSAYRTARISNYSGHEEKLRQKFETLAKQWKEKILNYSRITNMVADESYLAIIGMGRPAAIFLLEELRKEPDYWFAALRAILEVDPVELEDRGDLIKMSQAWINWGILEGYISE